MKINAYVTAYLGLGSNLNQPLQQLQAAQLALAQLPETKILAFSSIYRSTPMGPQNQPDYLNAVAAISTALAPLDLLQALQGIEQAQGRVRSERWGARTLDLDILIYGQQQMQHPDLQIPHNGLSQRAFVLYPLQEITPDLDIPGLGNLQQLIDNCPFEGLTILK